MIPKETLTDVVCGRAREHERRLVAWLCLASPVVAIAAWYVTSRYLLYVMYLKPVTADWDWWAAITWKPPLAAAILAGAIPWIWRASVSWSRPDERPWMITPAVLAACSVVVAAGWSLENQRVRWFFCEWALVRTANPSFARNTLFWESRTFPSVTSGEDTGRRVALVGSSQVYQGFDLEVLADHTAGVYEKNCLAGLGPMQYLFLKERVFERSPEVCVCLVSEFDFYRDDELPVNRLRWAASFPAVRELAAVAVSGRPKLDVPRRARAILQVENWSSNVDDIWAQRSAWADLGFAAASPIWRNRDHVRQVAFNYWWEGSAAGDSSRSPEALAVGASELAVARENLQRNVGRKRFVGANFAAFRAFAMALRDRQVRLLVLEGQSQPAVMSAYDPAYRLETREALRQMASELGFIYIENENLPDLRNDDFVDPYHLNTTGRRRLSEYLSQRLEDIGT